MDTKELQSKIKIIMDKEFGDAKTYFTPEPTSEGGLVEDYTYHYSRSGPPIINPDSYVPPLIETDEYPFRLNFPSLDLLLKLYYSIEHEKKLREHFLNTLTKEISSTKPIDFTYTRRRGLYTCSFDLSYLPFAALLKLGFIDMAINSLIVRTKSTNIEACLNFLIQFLKYEYKSVADVQLGKLKTFLEQLERNQLAAGANKGKKEYLLRQINIIEYTKLEETLDGITFEINQDKEKVIAEIKYFGFKPELIGFLNEVDSVLYSPTADFRAVSSGLVNGFRNWMAILVENISEEIQEKTKKSYPTIKESKIGNLRLYMKEHLPLSQREDEFIEAFVNILHVAGGHSITSDKKYFRLVRNIAIESAYFLLAKLKEFEAK